MFLLRVRGKSMPAKRSRTTGELPTGRSLPPADFSASVSNILQLFVESCFFRYKVGLVLQILR